MTRSKSVWAAVLAGLASFTVAAAGEVADDRALLDKAAAERAPRAAPVAAAPQAQPVAPAAAVRDELAEAEEQARIDLGVAEVRLETVRARRAMQSKQHPDAAARANRVLELIRGLPADLDLSVFELQAEGILAKAAREGVDTSAARPVTLSPPQSAGVVATSPAVAQPHESDLPADDADDARYRGAARIGRAYEGANTPDVDTTGNADVLRARAYANQNPEARGYRPGIEVIDGRSIEERDAQRIEYEGTLRTAYNADEAARFTHVDEARIAGDGIVTYPDNWLEQKAARARYRDGAIARSAPWTGADGKQWSAAIYDISDLTYVPPDFQLREGLTPGEAYGREIALDALYNGVLFRGYGEDLVASLPLLRALGAPLDDFEMRGPKYSRERADQIAEMIRALTVQSPEAKVEVIGP